MSTARIRLGLSLYVISITPLLAAAQCEVPFVPSDADSMGAEVAADGNRVLVGAFASQPNGYTSGSARVFERAGGIWSETDVIIPLDGAPSNLFGVSVALLGDTAAIGSPGHDIGAQGNGAVYIYERGPGGWSQVDLLTTPIPSSSQSFGTSLAMDDDELMVGTLNDDFENSAGTVEVFELIAGTWTYSERLRATDDAAYWTFGRSVDFQGDLAAVGAPGADKDGAVYIFEKINGDWRETAKISPSTSAVGDFGDNLALDGERLLVGCRYGPHCFLYERSGGVWNEIEVFTATDGVTSDYGRGVDLQGNLAAITRRYQTEVRRAENGWRALEEYPAGVGLLESAVFNGDGVVLGVSGLSEPDRVGFVPLPQQAQAGCFCDSGAPCGNEIENGGCANLLGTGARVTACGTTSISQDDLVLRVTGALPWSPGALSMGTPKPPMPFADGLVCIDRVGTFPVEIIDSQGSFGVGPGLSAFAAQFFPAGGQITAGSTWTFQAWYRDPLGPCGGGSNFSSTAAFSFQP